MRSIKVGLIGCGGRMRGVTKLVQQAAAEAGASVEVVALSDTNPRSIEAARSELDCPDTLQVYHAYHDLASDPAVEWVMVGSWNCFHAEHAIAALNAGKHVFCEKPLALTVDQCLAMGAAWKQSGRQFTIGFTLRYSPHYVRIKEVLDSGALGRIISMEFNETLDFNHGGYIHADWRRKTEWAGSHLLEKCCHDIDIVNWMTGSLAWKAASFGGCDFFTAANAGEVERVGRSADGKAAFQTWNVPGIQGNVVNPFNDDKDIVDNQVAIVEFANGVRSTFHTNCNVAIPERRLYICGTEGTLRADVRTGRIELQRIGFDTAVEDVSTDAAGGHGGGDPVLAKSLVDTMLKGTPPKTSIEEGLRSALTAFGIDRAMATGTVVDFTELWRQAGIDTES